MKVELGKTDLLTEQTYRMVIEYYIYYYNNLRPHSTLGYLPTPGCVTVIYLSNFLPKLLYQFLSPAGLPGGRLDMNGDPYRPKAATQSKV